MDSAALRANFNTPPKSDNKDFETWRLFELIQRFETKEIKTWGQLALELGVEPPDVGKGQSVQKVQQYSVRLKRWMRAMHIDAFFEFLMGKQHAYFTEIPHPSDPYQSGGRDGVQVEEDLAVRALDPSFKPKRGRRRNSEAELDGESDGASKQKQRKGTGEDDFNSSLSAFPASAHPDSYRDPWSLASAVLPRTLTPISRKATTSQTAVTSTAPSHLRWQLHGDHHGGASPHPMTAHPQSMAAHIDAAFDEPRSAVTPSAKRRRKHGPAVSSAWSSNTPGTRPRGRPPANKTFQEGPYSTFPADPNGRGSAPARITPDPLPPTVAARTTPPMPPPVGRRQSDGPGRLTGKLSLQVPQHTGGAVRLATPPPRLLVNGERNKESDGGSSSITPTIEAPPQESRPPSTKQRVLGNMQVQVRDIPGFAFEALKRILTSDLLRGELIGRRHRLSGDEAKRLADTVLQRLGVPRQDTDESKDDIARLTAASWLGLGEQLNVPLGPATSAGKKIVVTRFRTDADGYEEIVTADEGETSNVREVFDLSWIASINGCNGSFELKGLSLGEPEPHTEDTHDQMLRRTFALARDIGDSADGTLKDALQNATEARVGPITPGRRYDEDGIDWKAKCMAMEMGGRMAMGEYHKLRNRLIDQILDTLL
ncbi:hypothetical protein KC340_g11049 [Hortaea werneckii]|nr:hypothetical protein KC342_g11144 [Hortaea werneckii]KAI7096771.1 hypothetical protein KC339_g10165 [Hortaea werneckii]KAI7229577.1 hypothetical protein KC365_g7965 [Hortaea werneckii]KAI7308460.1 hypothetical protein KC340_g11049 [Hortaea werneckii]KAI7378074.1 hypothetical protein KC328_g14074 [Hortaea werneckii]